MFKKLEVSPIGYIKCSELKTIDDYKAKKKGEKLRAEVILNAEFEQALDEIETFDRVWLIFAFDRHLNEGFRLKIQPRIDPGKSQKRGLFLTRSPYRPNPIGLSCVKVIGHEGNVLHFENSDILDNTPLLDIKPYIPHSDSWPDSKAGWLDDLPPE